tara:strand:+ start:6243 stop:6500 length:258 start_codon:yes stop_codon:yes gene_type:complete
MRRTPQKTKHCPVDADWFFANGWRWDALSFTASIEFSDTRVLRSPAATWIRILGVAKLPIKHIETVGDALQLCEVLGIELGEKTE